MKFVHLTPFKNIKNIKKNGIRIGKGGGDKGVFAVPLTDIQYSNYWGQPLIDDLDYKAPVGRFSSWRLWHWWSRKPFDDKRGKLPYKSAAIVFSAPVDNWPVNVTFEMHNPKKSQEAIKLILNNPTDYLIDNDREELFRDYLNNPIDEEFGEMAMSIRFVKVANLKALGKLWHFVSTDDDASGDWSQVVFPNSIPPRYIERIIPLYRSNKRYKEIKNKTINDKLD
jgi:hypothetical protein